MEDDLIGYAKLSQSVTLDNDLSMFRRFGALNIRNILYLQSELQTLELKLSNLDKDNNDIMKGNAVWGQSRSWYWASKSQGAQDAGGEHEEGYWDLVLKIRSLLDRYSTSALAFLLEREKLPDIRGWLTW